MSAGSSVTSSRWARARSRCSTRCGSVDLDAPGTRRLLEGVVAGIAGYGNSIGIPTVGGEIVFEPSLRRQPARQRLLPRHREGIGHHQGRRIGCRQRRLLRWREDRPRRHPRRHDGLCRVRRQIGREAARGAGRRSVHGEAAARGMPRGDADRCADRHPGYGRRRSDLFDHRDGVARRGRCGDRRLAGTAARDRHDPVRDHALRVAGAHAARREARPRVRGRADLREVGSARRADRPRHRRWPAAGEGARRRRRRDPQSRSDRRSAGLPPSDERTRVSARGAATRSRRSRPVPQKRIRTRRCSRCLDRQRWRARNGSTASTTTWFGRIRSIFPAWAPASSGSKGPTARWRCRWMATAATAISIRIVARCSPSPKRRATSPARAPGRLPPPTA